MTRLAIVLLLGSAACLAGQAVPRLRPDVSPSAESAAVEVARDVAAAMAEHSAKTAGVAAASELDKAAVASFMRTLAEAGIDARKEWAWPAKLIPRPKVECQIVIDHDHSEGHDEVRATVSGAVDLSTKQRYVAKPWVDDAERTLDEDGIAVLEPADGDTAARCVGRSDLCPTLAEAKADADRRLAIALDRALRAKLGDKWLAARETVAPGQVLRLLGPRQMDSFAQTFKRPYGAMHRVYRFARLTEPELATLAHRAQGAWLARKLEPAFKGVGVFASAVLVLLAYLLAAGRFGRVRWLLRAASLALWLALAAAFVFGL